VGIVRFALRFPNTFLVVAVLMLFLGGAAITSMPKDIFPSINIPVAVVIWTYTGLSTTEMERRVTTYSEYSLSNNVNDIKNIESQTLPGVAVERVYFQPNVSIDLAMAQIVASMNSIRAVMPPGINPPTVVRYTASSVPVIQLSLSSPSMSEAQLYDYGLYRVRQTITSVPGSTLPTPYGGKPRQIMVDLDLHALQAQGLSPTDVTNAVSAQNLTVPSGQAKIGSFQYQVRLNATPDTVAALNAIPLRRVNGAMVYLRDVANVRDSAPPQQNIVRTEGRRSVLLTVLKNGDASTLDVVNEVKNRVLSTIRAAAPKDMRIDTLFDQSLFVAAAIDDVLREGVIAAGLTGLMILTFLGSWRSTLIVMVSIPLAILTSLAMLNALGHTINLMTLGGLALAVGILVDDATVTIENTYRYFEQGQSLRRSILFGGADIAKPTLISTLAICMAFISVLFLRDAPKYLFTPQALAVVFAMLASYGLSRTLVPVLSDKIVRGEHHGDGERKPPSNPVTRGLARYNAAFHQRFERLRDGYAERLRHSLEQRFLRPLAAAVVIVIGGLLFLFVGEDYFPAIDAGQMTLHVRGRSGLRIEETERLFQQVEDVIRQVVPDSDRGLILDNIGLPALNYNLAFGDGTAVGLNDGQIMVSLKPGHAPTAGYMKTLRTVLRERFPDATFYFQPADMVTQILNFVLPSPIDIQVTGRDAAKNLKIARRVEAGLQGQRGVVDVHLHQIVDAPEFFVSVDRSRAQELGLNEQQVANNVNVSLSSSYQVSPNFWSDPSSGIPYPVAVQTPEYRNASLSDLDNTPLLGATDPVSGQPIADLLTNVATFKRGIQQTVANHSNVQPVYDIYANVQDRDLGTIARDIAPMLAELRKDLGPGNSIVVRGHIQSMNDAFGRIGLGLLFAVVFIYLLMVVNFQTWIDPLVVLCALPLTLCGTTLLLFVTGTTFSIPSLMGAIMAIGTASANSILLVTFARERQMQETLSPLDAAVAAGSTRLRPVLMTAGAMVVGMLPMALGLGGGAEQNAALARAVIGGVLVGTTSTLFFVPYLYTLLRGLVPVRPADDDPDLIGPISNPGDAHAQP